MITDERRRLAVIAVWRGRRGDTERETPETIEREREREREREGGREREREGGGWKGKRDRSTVKSSQRKRELRRHLSETLCQIKRFSPEI